MSRFFGPAIQVAFVVPDIDTHIRTWLESGVGPFFVVRNQPLPIRYRGIRRDPAITVAIAYSGPTMYEFIEPHDDTPSAYRDFLDRQPQGGLHHLAYYCDDFDAPLEHAKGQGAEFRVVQEMLTADGTVFEIYAEPVSAPGQTFSQLVLRHMFGPVFARMEAAAIGWSGDEPVRSLFDLLPQAVRSPTE